ncbi:MAG: hypothetical protein ACRBF0_04025 [Calditrichia bacterium]
MRRTPTSRLSAYVRSPGMFTGFLVIILLVTASYLLTSFFPDLEVEQNLRLVYGSIAACLLVAAMLYGIRQRRVKLNWGRSNTWLQLHIYGGGLFLLLMLMHSGFKVPVGWITWLLWTLSFWMTVSGLLGVILQKWIPKLLSSGLNVEVIYERIPDLVLDIRSKSEELVGEAELPLQDFYRQHLAVAFSAPKNRFIYFLDITGGSQARLRQFDYLRALLSRDGRASLNTLESYYKTKLELDAHYTLQKALRWWLFLHAPLSLLLIVLLLLHLFAVVYY